jgi:hypothetical protein
MNVRSLGDKLARAVVAELSKSRPLSGEKTQKLKKFVQEEMVQAILGKIESLRSLKENKMKITKTQLKNIIAEEINRALNEGRGFEERRDNALYYAYASTQRGVYPEKVADLFDMALDKAIEAGGVSSETEESRDVFIDIEDEIKKAEGVGRENIAKVLMALNTLDGMSVDQLKAIPRSDEAAKAAEKRAQPEIKRKRAVQAKRSIRDIMGKLDEGMDIMSMMSMPLDQVAGMLDVAPAVLAGVLATLAGKSGGLPNMENAEEKETEDVMEIPRIKRG